jgi:hypothetical protein
MNDETKNELKRMSLEELFNILNRTDELIELAKTKVEDVSEEELEPIKKKRGSKN